MKDIKGQNIAYVRVSTIDQNEQRQIDMLESYNIDKWFSEKVSGKNTNRPELKSMLDYVREGDTIHISDFSRLARNTKDLLNIVELLDNKGVKLISIKENIDTLTPTGKLLLTVIGAIAEFERQNLLERQAEGIAIAKREGKYKGGKKKKIDKVLFSKLKEDYEVRKITKVKFAKDLGVSRPTLDRLLKEGI